MLSPLVAAYSIDISGYRPNIGGPLSLEDSGPEIGLSLSADFEFSSIDVDSVTSVC